MYKGSIQINLWWSIFNMCEKTVSKKQCYSLVITPEKPWGFRAHTMTRTLFISVFLMKIKFVLTGFLSAFHHLRQLLLWSLVIKGKNVLSSKIKSRKKYWISHKNNNVTCVIGWFFIILFSFSLSFICTSFMFVVGSCNFDAPENLKCVRQQGLIDIKHHKLLILFIIPRKTLYSPKTYLPSVTSAF